MHASAHHDERIAEQLVRDTPEYNAALELEMWKHAEKQKFIKQLQDKEKQLLAEFESALKKKEEEKEKVFAEKQTRLETLESKLKKAIVDVEKREKKLVDLEKELHRRKLDLDKDHERINAEMQHVVKMNQEECVHKVNLERVKINEIEKRYELVNSRFIELDGQYNRLLQEHHDLQQRMSSLPQSALQAEISKLVIEKNDIERRLQESLQSKKNYKKLWKKVNDQLEQVKRTHQHESVVALQRERDELLELRRRWLSADASPINPFYFPQQQHNTPFGANALNIQNHYQQQQQQQQSQQQQHPLYGNAQNHQSIDWGELSELKKTLLDLIEKEKSRQLQATDSQQKQHNNSSDLETSSTATDTSFNEASEPKQPMVAVTKSQNQQQPGRSTPSPQRKAIQRNVQSTRPVSAGRTPAGSSSRQQRNTSGSSVAPSSKKPVVSSRPKTENGPRNKLPFPLVKGQYHQQQQQQRQQQRVDSDSDAVNRTQTGGSALDFADSVLTNSKFEANRELRRLIQEKQELLRSGAYEENDPIIQQLTLQIGSLTQRNDPAVNFR